MCNGIDDDCDGTTHDECGIWHLPYGASQWNVFPLDRARALNPSQISRHAPTRPVRAAFDIETLGVIYVLTDTTWHELDANTSRWSAPDGQWRNSGSIAVTFPMPDATWRAYWNSGVLNAWSVPSWHPEAKMMMRPNEGMQISTRQGVLFYNFNIATRSFVANVAPVSASTIVWEGIDVPSYASVRSLWLDTHNRRGWVHGVPAMICSDPTNPVPDITVHSIVITNTRVHFMDAGHCFRYFGSTPIANFGPFTLPNAPAPAMIGESAFLADGVWVFKAP
jgi:hypothetical protein